MLGEKNIKYFIYTKSITTTGTKLGFKKTY